MQKWIISTLHGCAATAAAQAVVLDNSRAYGARLDPQLLIHATVSYKMNRNKLSHTFSAQMINLTGEKDFGGYNYNRMSNTTEKVTRAISIPSISYKMEF